MKATRNPIKILFIINQIYPLGGAPTALLRLAHQFALNGYPVSFVTFRSKDVDLSKIQEDYSIKIVDLQIKSGESYSLLMKMCSTIRGLAELYTLMKKEHFDLVQSFVESSNIMGPILGWLAGIPLRFTSQRSTLSYKPKWFYLLDRWVANSFLVDKMVAVSEETKKFCIQVEGIRPNKVITIPNGVDTEKFKPIDKDVFDGLKKGLFQDLGIPTGAFVIVSVGRFRKEKGYDVLIKAAREVLNHCSSVYFLLIGDGSGREDLISLMEFYKVSSNFRMLRVKNEDIPIYLGISNLFVLPSRWEGMPNALLEAMATSLPVIASSVDGIKDVIKHGHNGILVPPEDASQLAQAIIYLSHNEDVRIELGRQARITIERNFKLEMMFKRYESLYLTLYDSKTRKN